MATKTNNGTKKVYVSNRPNISMKELTKMFPYMSKDELERDCNENEWIKLEKFLEQERKKNEGYQARAEQPDVVRLTMSTELSNHNPRVYWSCNFADGSYKSGKEHATGYGYDKESTCMAEIFEACLSGMLWRKRKSKKEVPYGLRVKGTWFPHFSGGVGVSCYYRIAEWLGGKMEHTGWTDRSDSYIVTFPAKKK